MSKYVCNDIIKSHLPIKGKAVKTIRYDLVKLQSNPLLFFYQFDYQIIKQLIYAKYSVFHIVVEKLNIFIRIM